MCVRMTFKLTRPCGLGGGKGTLVEDPSSGIAGCDCPKIIWAAIEAQRCDRLSSDQDCDECDIVEEDCRTLDCLVWSGVDAKNYQQKWWDMHAMLVEWGYLEDSWEGMTQALAASPATENKE